MVTVHQEHVGSVTDRWVIRRLIPGTLIHGHFQLRLIKGSAELLFGSQM